jgi:polysaccharide deacetylase family protein (PEP-CTERM system associated)
MGSKDAAVRNALTVDVEDYFQVAALAGSVRAEDWDCYESRVAANTRRLLDLFAHKRIRATFFVLGWVAERQPALVRQIADHGHEIASHGYSHQLIYNQTPVQFRAETTRAKRVLEDLIQRPVVGYRAASYSITRASLWALDILAELGFTWDSSIFPVRHDRYGLPGSSRWPHRLRTPAGGNLIEFPLSTCSLVGYRLPIAGGGYFRLYPYWLSRAGLSRINRRERRPFIFYLHPWEIDPSQPRIPAGRLSSFRHYNNLHRCEPRLKRLLDSFEFGTVSEVLADLQLHQVEPPLPQAAGAGH